MTSVQDLVELVDDAARTGSRILPVGGGTKPALSRPASDEIVALDMSGLRGIVEYDPAELTLTALAGTPVAEVAQALAQHGQHLPFDPPLASRGATLGGVVAAGTSGPSAFRHGGVRDFVIGVDFIDGRGRLVSGGGKVVKNAAGFDFPKLMVGSAGRLAVLVRVSFKVFPRPRATTTLAFPCATRSEALAAVAVIARGPLEADAVDVDVDGRLLVRLAGDPETLPARARRCAELVGRPAEAADDDEAWKLAESFGWVPDGATLVRVPLTARRVAALDAALAGVPVRLSLGANLAWIAWPASRALGELHTVLRTLGLAGCPLTGRPGPTVIGARSGGAFAERVRRALDPDRRFPED